jgi:hypothetical protein
MNKRYKLLLAVILSGFISQACAPRLTELKVGPEKPSSSILIAADSSSFKDRVRERIIEKYKETCAIRVVAIKDLNSLKADGYDVVLIMDTCMAWSGFNPSLKNFMDNEDNRKKTVLSMTAGDPDWKYSYQGVDAVTSASRIEKEEDFFRRIDGEIERVLQTTRR